MFGELAHRLYCNCFAPLEKYVEKRIIVNYVDRDALRAINIQMEKEASRGA